MKLILAVIVNNNKIIIVNTINLTVQAIIDNLARTLRKNNQILSLLFRHRKYHKIFQICAGECRLIRTTDLEEILQNSAIEKGKHGKDLISVCI